MRLMKEPRDRNNKVCRRNRPALRRRLCGHLCSHAGAALEQGRPQGQHCAPCTGLWSSSCGRHSNTARRRISPFWLSLPAATLPCPRSQSPERCLSAGRERGGRDENRCRHHHGRSWTLALALSVVARLRGCRVIKAGCSVEYRSGHTRVHSEPRYRLSTGTEPGNRADLSKGISCATI